MKINHHLLIMLLVALTGVTQAKPFIPTDDRQVLQRLPEQLFKYATSTKIKMLRTQLKANPQDWSSASQLAQHYIDLAQTQADPRYMGYGICASAIKPMVAGTTTISASVDFTCDYSSK